MSASFSATLKTKYLALPQSDRRALLVLSFFLLVTLFYMATTWSFHYRQKAVESFLQNRSLIGMLYEAKNKGTSKKVANKIEGADQALLTLVSSTANEQKITFKRYQPEGERTLKLWIENVGFNNLLFWLNRIDKKNGILVQEIAVEQAKDEGFVDVRLTLQR